MRFWGSMNELAEPYDVRPWADHGPYDCETLTASFDWSRTPLGRRANWPPHLRNTVSLILKSKVAMATLWGPSGVMIYNDAYAVIAGDRHLSVFGSNVCEGWPEVADFNSGVLKTCLSGESLSYRDIEMTLFRFQRDEQVFFDLDYSPILDEHGKPAGVLAICVETTAKVKAERWKNTERDRQKQMFEQAPGFMAMLSGPEHVFVVANEAYRQLAGNRTLLGLTVRDAFPEIADQGFYEILDRVYASGEPFIGRSVEILLKPGDEPNRVFLDFVYQPVKDPDGRTTGIFVHGVDVTTRHEAEVALRDEERRLRLAHRIAGVGPMEVDIASRTVYAPENFWRMWGLEPRDSGPTELFESLVIPEDAGVRSSDATRRDGTAPTAVEYRIRRPDTGEIRWLSRHVEFVNGPDGKPAKMFGVVKDITERREAESRQKMLAHELEHRIKNLLAMVGAIASRTLREGNLADARDAFLQRLKAMSEAHGLLHETRWKGTSMRQVVDSACRSFPPSSSPSPVTR